MSILFKNKTKYTEKIYEEYLKFHYKKFHISYMFYTITIIILIVFCICLHIKYHNYILALTFFFILAAFIIWRFFRPVKQVKNEYESDKISNEKTFTFEFFENHFIISDNKSYSEIKYRDLYKIFETKNFFYFYKDKTHAFIIDKGGFIKGNSQSFSKFIQKKCKFKYKTS